MSNKKYVTVNQNGMGLYDIAAVMTASGSKMNHSTVRNIINRAFFKVAKNMSRKYDLDYTEEEIFNIAKSPQFQESLIQCLQSKKYER